MPVYQVWLEYLSLIMLLCCMFLIYNFSKEIEVITTNPRLGSQGQEIENDSKDKARGQLSFPQDN